MRIGVPTEIKANEYRVGLTPQSVAELAAHGHEICVQRGAGAGIGESDENYRTAGATIGSSAADVFAGAELIVKVKEPQPVECDMLRADQILFTYLHLAANETLTRALLASGVSAIAYETVTDRDGSLPLLAPMSEVAGRLSVQSGARALERESGGAGILLGGVAGVAPAHVVVIGGGVVGTNAIQMALGLHARVTVLDKSLSRLRELDVLFGGRLNTVYASMQNLADAVTDADLVIGAVLVPGAAAPKLVNRELLARMRPGSAIVDVAIDQGGCFETSRPTTHADPTFVVDDIVHYCVANMPGAVPRTATHALNNATLPFVVRLAGLGLAGALEHDSGLRDGLNTFHGELTQPAVAETFGLRCQPVATALRAA